MPTSVGPKSHGEVWNRSRAHMTEAPTPRDAVRGPARNVLVLLEFGEDGALRDGGPGSTDQAGDDAGLVRGDGVLHLHGLEDHDEVALGDFLALGHGDLDDGALHRRGDGVTGCLCHRRPPPRLRAFGFLRMTPAGATAVAERELAGQRDLDATSTDLDDDGLTRQDLVLVLDRTDPG